MAEESAPEPVSLPPRSASRHGLVQVYTGTGKGKTTAALGLAIRAAGHNWQVHIVQFMKSASYGELLTLANVPNIKIQRFGGAHWIDPQHIREEDRQAATAALEHGRRVMAAGACDLLILDEINVALAYRLVPVAAVLELLQQRPAGVEVVLTGRGAPPEIIEAADLVTEMVEIKHPYRQGLKARPGIEY